MRANGSSGLVRTDYYDWFTNLPQFISETKPATIVIMMGSNDRQQMQIGDIREKFGTEVWFKEYERRIDELLALAGRPKVPLLWVGLPAFQSPSPKVWTITRPSRSSSETERSAALWPGAGIFARRPRS